MTSLVDFPYWRKEKGNIRFCLVCLPSLTCRIKIDVSFRFKFGICVLQIGVSFEFSVIWWSVNVSDNHSHNLRKGPPVTTVLLIQYLILNLVLLWGIRLCSLMIIWFSMFWQYSFSESYCASKFVLEVSSWIPLCLYHMFDIILAIDDENKTTNTYCSNKTNWFKINLCVNREPFCNQF